MGGLGSIPGLGRFPGEGNSYSLQYSGLENSMDYPWGCKESDTTERLHSFLTNYHKLEGFKNIRNLVCQSSEEQKSKNQGVHRARMLHRLQGTVSAKYLAASGISELGATSLQGLPPSSPGLLSVFSSFESYRDTEHWI